MCCFSGPVTHVGDTQIFARTTAANRELLAYRMTVEAAAAVAMILPIPVPAQSADDAVRFIDLSGYPDFFADLERGFPAPLPTRSNGPQPGGVKAAPLPVVTVGSFVASFVPRPADFSRLDARFRLPDTVLQSLPVYADWGFAVFQLEAGRKTVHPMAFDFPLRTPRTVFFPTMHIHDGAVRQAAHFHHTLYLQGEGTQVPVQRPSEVRDAIDRVLAAGFTESPQLASAFTTPARSSGLIRSDAHVYKLNLHGELPNRDLMLVSA